MSSPRGTSKFSASRAGEPLLDHCEPFLAGSAIGSAGAPRPASIAGLGLAPLRRIDPLRMDSGPFLSLVDCLQSRLFADRGLSVPRWTQYDCGLVCGAIVGLAKQAERLAPSARAALDLEPDARCLVPISLLIAIPTLRSGAWHLYALGSLPGGGEGAKPETLLPLTLAVALLLLEARSASAVVRWTAPELAVYARLCPLELLTAWTPAHSFPDSLTCRFDVSSARLARALVEEPVDDRGDVELEVDAHDGTALRKLQMSIESGRRYEITGPPRARNGRTLVPLREVAT